MALTLTDHSLPMDPIPETYSETLDFLYEKLPMFSRTGDAALKKDLTNIRLLCTALDDPQEKFKSIHIAGTNGKGSVSHMLAAVLQQSGDKTGLYTSPHLKDFRERIRIDGEMIPKEWVTMFVKSHFDLIKKIEPSFFEITVAMAFAWFAAEQVDVAVIETGLGGRLDSTNILLPEISIITNISWDHQHILGNTLAAIAGEKAGIIKEGIPVIIGEAIPETIPVFTEKATTCHAPLHFAEKEWQVLEADYAVGELAVTVRNAGGGRLSEHDTFRLDLSGTYQEKNLCTALSAIDVLRKQGWHIDSDNVHVAMSDVKRLTGLRGRWEVLGEHPLIVADVGHNEAGIRAILARLETLTYDRLHIVTGFVRDKAVDVILRLFPKDAHYYFCQADTPRALPAEELLTRATAAGLDGAAFPTVLSAYEAAKGSAGEKDMILICGSVFIVAEVLP